MPARPLVWILVACSFLVHLSLARVATAEPNLKFVRLSLAVQRADRPAHLCIVSRFGSSDSSVPLEQITRSGASKTPPDTIGWEQGSDEWFFANEAAKAQGLPKAIAAATQSLAKQHDCAGNLTQGANSDACRPRLNLPLSLIKQMRMVCVSNSQPSADPLAPVVIVLLEGFRTQPSVLEISLSNTVAFVGFDPSAIADPGDLVATVVGGHYTPGNSASVVAREILIPLQPRCPWQELELPPSVALPDFVNVAPANAPDCSFTPNREQLHVRMPPDAQVSVLALWKELGPDTAPVDDPTREVSMLFRAWPTAGQGGVRQLRAREATFWWERHCLYNGACPTARLIEAGVDCAGAPIGNACEYTCSSNPDRSGFDLPASVHFQTPKDTQSGGSQAEWDDRLERVGATLTSFVPASKRELTVKMARPTSAGGALTSMGVNAVQLSIWGGRRISQPINVLTYGGTYVLPASNLECGREVGYQYDGDRLHSPNRTQIDGGELRLKNPEDTAVSLLSGLYLGVGYFRPYKNWTDYARSLDFPGGFYGMLEATFGIQRPRSIWRWEPFFGVSYGRREYGAATFSEDGDVKGGAFARIAAGLRVGIQFPALRFAAVTVPGLGSHFVLAGGCGKSLAPTLSQELPGQCFFMPGVTFAFQRVNGQAVRLNARAIVGERLVAPEGRYSRVLFLTEVGYSFSLF